MWNVWKWDFFAVLPHFQIYIYIFQNTIKLILEILEIPP